MLTALLRRSFKESIWIWRSTRALSFFGRPTRGLFWVVLPLLKRWMILTTVLQLSFRLLAIFLWPWPSSYSETIRLLRSSGSSLPCWNIQWPVWESVRDALQIWTHLLPMHMGLVTLMSHMTFWRETNKQCSIWTFRCVVSFVTHFCWLGFSF